MADRQTRNVSLPPHQDAFVDALVAGGRYKTASEVLRDGLRLLEENEHRRLLEKWLYDGGLSDTEDEALPPELKERAKALFGGMVDRAMQDVENGRVTDGPTAMQRLRERIEARGGVRTVSTSGVARAAVVVEEEGGEETVHLE